MKIVKTIDEVRSIVKGWRAEGLTVGLFALKHGKAVAQRRDNIYKRANVQLGYLFSALAAHLKNHSQRAVFLVYIADGYWSTEEVALCRHLRELPRFRELRDVRTVNRYVKNTLSYRLFRDYGVLALSVHFLNPFGVYYYAKTQAEQHPPA